MPKFNAPGSPLTPSSTPICVSGSSFAGGATGATHQLIDLYQLHEFERNLIVDVEQFIEMFVLPAPQTTEMTLLGIMATRIDQNLANEYGRGYWEPPSWSNDQYLLWFGDRLQAICRLAADVFDESLLGMMASLCIDSSAITEEHDRPSAQPEETPDIEAWRWRLRERTWSITSRTMMKGSRANHAPDIMLSGSAAEKGKWASALLIGEHESGRGTTATAAAQLAGYVSDAFGVQPFRHFIHGITIIPKAMRLWRLDRSGGLASHEFSMATKNADEQKMLIEIILAYTIMDDIRLGFDPDIYGDAECTIPCRHTAHPDEKQPGQPDLKDSAPKFYIRMDSRDPSKETKVYQLLQLIFIRPGIVSRGTVCFYASDEAGQAHVIKKSWRHENMPPEGDLLSGLDKTEGLYGVVRLENYDEKRLTRDIRGGIVDGERLALRRSTETVMRETIEPTIQPVMSRIFTRTVLRDVGYPLQGIQTPSELIRTILGAFIGHGTLYHHYHILHRDISLSNILKSADELPGPGPSPLLSRLTGFLIDLDYAVKVDANSLETSPSGAPHRIGTLPYMAIDILNGSEAVHLYHHDVESFFYVLIWILIYEYKPSPGDDSPPTPATPAAPLRRSARLADLAPSSNSIPTTRHSVELADSWTVDQTFHPHTKPDPLASWVTLPGTAMAGAKRNMLSNEENFLHLLSSIRPRFNSVAVIDLLKSMRRSIFVVAMKGDFGPVELFATPIERGILLNLGMRKRAEKRLYDEVTAAMVVAIQALKAEEDTEVATQ